MEIAEIIEGPIDGVFLQKFKYLVSFFPSVALETSSLTGDTLPQPSGDIAVIRSFGLNKFRNIEVGD
jgi:hypothetical protein